MPIATVILIAPNAYALTLTERYSSGLSDGSQQATRDFENGKLFNTICDPSGAFTSQGQRTVTFCDGWTNGYTTTWNQLVQYQRWIDQQIDILSMTKNCNILHIGGNYCGLSWADVGGIATAGALILVGVQTFSTRKQTRLMQEQLGRAWVGTVRDKAGNHKITLEFGQIRLDCRNYGQLPAKILCTRSAKILYTGSDSSLQQGIPESDIRAAAPNLSHRTIIFPTQEQPFSTSATPLPDEAFREKRIWFGFIVEYTYHTNDIGEYGVIGYLQFSTLGSDLFRTDEWYEPRHSGKPLKLHQKIWRRIPRRTKALPDEAAGSHRVGLR